MSFFMPGNGGGGKATSSNAFDGEKEDSKAADDVRRELVKRQILENQKKSRRRKGEMTLWEKIKERVFVHPVEKAQLPPPVWILTIGFLQVCCWIAMIVGETILASDNYVLATENDAFTFTAVGLVAALNTGLFVYFIFNASEKMFRYSVVGSLMSTCTQIYLVCLGSRDVLVTHNLYSTYESAVANDTANGGGALEKLEAYVAIFDNNGRQFPPSTWVSLEILKLLGCVGGLIVTFVALETLFFVKVEVLLEPPKRRQDEIDTEDEEDEETDMIRRAAYVTTVSPTIAGFSLVAAVSFLSMSFVVSAVPTEQASFVVGGRLSFSVICALSALNLVAFRFNPTEFGELKTLLISLATLVACVEHLISIKTVQVVTEGIHETVFKTPGNSSFNESSALCFRECPVGSNPAAVDNTTACETVCVEPALVCDGMIDAFGNETDVGRSFFPLSFPSPPLLFPDELFCKSRILPALGLNYALAAMAFCLAAAVAYRTKSLVEFYWRRHQRKRRKRLQRKASAANKRRQKKDTAAAARSSRPDSSYGSLTYVLQQLK